jgi:hypothetical protein
MEKIEIVLQTAFDIQLNQLKIKHEGSESSLNFHKGPSLFYDLSKNDNSSSSIETNLLFLGSVYQEAFFGRTCGFQFCDSLQTPLTGAAVALASYNDGYEAYSNKENHATIDATTQTVENTDNRHNSTMYFSGQATLFKSLVSGTKYILDPELRARKVDFF